MTRQAGSSPWLITFGAGLAALVVSASVALAATPVYEFVTRLLGVSEGIWAGVLFSGFLLLLGLVVAVWRPREVGFQVGSAVTKLRTTIAVTVALASALALALSLMPPTPYSESDWIFEVVAVPISEELFFRGAVLAGLVWMLGKAHSRMRATRLAFVFGGIAFGVAHLSNLTIAPGSFVIPQAIFAVLLGTVAGYLRTTTDSIFPAIFLHAVVNGVVILF